MRRSRETAVGARVLSWGTNAACISDWIFEYVGFWEKTVDAVKPACHGIVKAWTSVAAPSSNARLRHYIDDAT
jgi:hypothetical protein